MSIRCKCGMFLSKMNNDYDKLCKKCSTTYISRSAAGIDWFSGSDGNDYIAVNDRLTLKPKEEKKMSFFSVDPKQAGGSFAPVPEGKYESVISKVEVKTSSKGNQMISCQLTIRDDIDQEAKKRKLFDYLVASEGGMYKFHQVAAAIGLPAGYEIPNIETFAKEIANQCVKVTVKHEAGQDQNGNPKTQERVNFYATSEYPRQRPAGGADPFSVPGGNDGPIDISDEDLPF